jgi:Spy/CpxP family protein refolding chaperone
MIMNKLEMKGPNPTRPSLAQASEFPPSFRSWFIFLVLCLAFSGSATAQMPAPDEAGEERYAPRIERLAERLGLSEAQIEVMTNIHAEAQQVRITLRKESMRLHNELQGEMLKDEPSESKVLDLAEQIGRVRIKQQQSRLTQQLAIREQLTSEQRDKFLLMTEQRHKKGRGHRHSCSRHGFSRQWGSRRPHHSPPEVGRGDGGPPNREGI